MDRGNEKSNPAFALMIEENHEKTSLRLAGTGIWTRDLPNGSLVRYHGATSLGEAYFSIELKIYLYSLLPTIQGQLVWYFI